MRVVIIDDDVFVTTSLKTILGAEEDIQVEGVGHDGTEALTLYEQLRPDVLLMDIQMKEMSGIDAARKILEEHPGARIVFLTTFADDEYIVSALRMGARGYLIKQEVSSIAPALRSVLAGQNVLGSEVLSHVESLMVSGARGIQGASGTHGVQEAQAVRVAQNALGTFEAQDALGVQGAQGAQQTKSSKLSQLSERELEIVELIAQGLDNKEIAGTLYISEGTVRNYISTILTKLDLKNRTQLAILYYQS